MDPAITTHVLNTASGSAAAKVAVRLSRKTGVAPSGDFLWEPVQEGVTDEKGRLGLLKEGLKVQRGEVYELTFDVASYFADQGVECFYPSVKVAFVIQEGHHHVPLLIAPFAYSTYRGC
ncbi:unnamed protein product [Effrenium voratum]|nr:unnamed protein product [Effrenium voratum]